MADLRLIGGGKYLADFSRFTPLGVPGSVFSITEDASPELRALAEAYPDLMRRALRHVADVSRRRLKSAIRSGGPPGGAAWPERSLMHRYRRLDMWFNGREVSLKQKTNSGPVQLSSRALRRAGKNIRGKFFLLGKDLSGRSDFRYWSRGGRVRDEEQSIPDAFHRWKSPHGRSGHRNVISMSGSIYSNLVWEKTGDMEYSIGILTPNLAEKFKVVQEGKTTAVTPAMRRAFWAAGVPLDDAKTALVMPPRPLVDPVFKELQPEVEDLLMNRITGYLEGTTRYV